MFAVLRVYMCMFTRFDIYTLTRSLLRTAALFEQTCVQQRSVPYHCERGVARSQTTAVVLPCQCERGVATITDHGCGAAMLTVEVPSSLHCGDSGVVVRLGAISLSSKDSQLVLLNSAEFVRVSVTTPSSFTTSTSITSPFASAAFARAPLLAVATRRCRSPTALVSEVAAAAAAAAGV